MRETNALIRFINDHYGETMVVATLVKAEGSTYRKVGAKKLIIDSDINCGLITGGCVESDIVQFALKNPEIKRQEVFYSSTDEDRLFGSGLGCNGKLTVEVELINWNVASVISQYLDFIPERDELNLVIAGSGVDLEPLYDLVRNLRWNLRFIDYRSDWCTKRRAEQWPMVESDAAGVVDFIKNPARTALLVMSHNYPYDLEILKHALPLKPAYLGILGPQSRKRQLLLDLKTIYKKTLDDSYLSNIHGPIGLDGFGEGETAVALSVVAQLQTIFFGKNS